MSSICCDFPYPSLSSCLATKVCFPPANMAVETVKTGTRNSSDKNRFNHRPSLRKPRDILKQWVAALQCRQEPQLRL